MRYLLFQVLFTLCSACGAHTTSDRAAQLAATGSAASQSATESRETRSRSKESSVPPNQTATQLRLRLRDASTPPQHHRSYTISVTPSTDEVIVNVSVDVYGKVIASSRNAVSDEQWAQFSKDAAALSLVEDSDEATTGASAYTLDVTLRDGVRTATWTRDVTPNAQRLTEFARRVEQLVHDLPALLATPYAP